MSVFLKWPQHDWFNMFHTQKSNSATFPGIPTFSIGFIIPGCENEEIPVVVFLGFFFFTFTLNYHFLTSV